mgnify:CR=1 FL=1
MKGITMTAIAEKSIFKNPKLDAASYCSITDLAKELGCSRNFVYSRCKSGKFPSLNIDGRYFISMKFVTDELIKPLKEIQPKNYRITENER